MINISDIYKRMDISLLEEDYWILSVDDKKKLIDKKLREYIIFKIGEISSKALPESSKEMSIIELFELLCSLVPKEEHFDTIRHFTHYILGICSNLQGWSITWWGEENDELVENPLVEFDINGRWDKLITDNRTNLVKIFKFVYCIFKNEFMLMKNSEKKLELSAKDLGIKSN